MSIPEMYKEVDRLMGLFDYNGAISLLVQIVKENPDEMDNAQKKIQEIRAKKEEFNAKYEELIRVLFKENNYEKGLKIISELESMDKNPNTATSESLKDARISAELIYFRLLFNDIMDRAQKQINLKNYDQAASIYKTGFDLHKRTYDERNYGDIIKGPADKERKILLKSLDSFISEYKNLAQFTPQMLTTSIEDNRTVHQLMINEFKHFTKLRNDIWKAGYVFEEQNKLLAKINPDIREDFYLSFSNRIIFGRSENRFKEGLVRDLDAYWEERISQLQEEYIRKTNELMNRGDLLFNRGSWQEAQTVFDETEYWAARGVELTELWSGRINLKSSYTLYQISQDFIDKEYNTLVDLRIKQKKAVEHSRLSLFNQRLQEYSSYDSNDLALMSERRDELSNELQVLEPAKNDWNTFIGKYNKDTLYTDNFAGKENILFVKRIDKTIEKYRTLDGKISLDSANLEIQPLENEYAQMKTLQKKSQSLLNGIPPETSKEGDLSILYVYPEESSNLVDNLKEQNTALSDKIKDFKSRYQEIRAAIPQTDEMAVYIGRAEAMLLNLENDLKEYQKLQRKADQNIASAERFLGEGEFRFGQAESALSDKDFNKALQDLTAAQELFVQALSFNEKIIDRTTLDKRISDLQTRILQEENKEVVRFVRENVNKGKSLYLQGLYSQSEVFLLKAESRWFTTNTDPNNEINYWLNLVRAALSVESGRTIEETEPLYAEMTQFLNLAYTNYQEGKAQMESGNKSEALALLDKADQNLNQILIPMPLNQQASVLKLKIQQLKDPELFKVTFDEKFKSAVSRLKLEPDTAYIDLKDLSAIQPNYPGIKKAIYNAEILLGIRRPPPDLAALAESKSLYKKAFAIVEGNVRSQFPVALTQLDRAIELNPENQDAITLKDRIQLDAGGQATAVLSSAANALFKSAEEKYINGDYFEAYAIVQQLLGDKKTSSYPPLQDLKRRIESKF